MTNEPALPAETPMRVLLAGPDTLYFSCDLPISEAMRDRLNEEKATAQALAEERRAHCPEWLGARVCPQGAKGGYAFLVETEDSSISMSQRRKRSTRGHLRRSLLMWLPGVCTSLPHGIPFACRPSLRVRLALSVATMRLWLLTVANDRLLEGWWFPSAQRAFE